MEKAILLVLIICVWEAQGRTMHMEKKLNTLGDVRMADLKSFGELEKIRGKREAFIRKIRCKRQGGRPGCGRRG